MGSYRMKMGFPAWRMYDRDGRCVASIRAFTLKEARNAFARIGLTGNRVKMARPRGR